MEKRHNYVKKVAEISVAMFISQDKVNVRGIVLAGSADFKVELGNADFFDPRLQAKIMKTVDVSYGGENGFNQAIELSGDTLGNVKFIQEKKLIQQYFDEISQDTGKYCFGIEDTMKALDQGAVESLIVWENLDILRVVVKSPSSESNDILFLKPEQLGDPKFFIDESGAEKETLDSKSLVEFFTEEYKTFGCALEFVTNKSTEGSQFCKGFGGIGGLLRYRLDFRAFDDAHPDLANIDDDTDSEVSFDEDEFDFGL